MKMNSEFSVYPCKGCTDRHLHCHSDCERYLDIVRKNAAKRDAYQAGKELENILYPRKRRW